MRKKLRKINVIFIYLSITFLTIALYKADYLYLPKFFSFSYLILSIIFVYLGMIGNALGWYKILRFYSVKINFYHSLVSMGISIFGKYIPGKVWMILGRSSYISEKSGVSLIKLSSLSLMAQVISIWIGLLIGFLGLVFFINLPEWLNILIVLLLFLPIPLVLKPFNNFSKKIIPQKLFLKLSNININLNSLIKFAPWFAISWICYCVGFYFFAGSLIKYDIPLLVGFTFLISAATGIIAVISPGGLGVREGILFTLLLLIGISENDSTNISILSRFWFLIGELLFFLTALFIKVKHKNY